MKTDTILEIKHASVNAGDKPLLRDISLSIRTGEFISVRGQSGVGKTTFLRSVAGLICFATGEVLFHDLPPEKVACPDGKKQGMPAYRRRVMLVEQQPVLLGATIEDCLRHPFAFRVYRGVKFDRDKMFDLLKRIGLGKIDVAKSVDELSVGQKQRISLVRALLLEPEIILLDEPTSALDEKAKLMTETILLDFAKHGMSALIVTHDPSQAERLCPSSLELSEFAVADTTEKGE